MPIGNEMNGLQSQQKPHELQLVGLSVPFGQDGLNLRLAASYPMRRKTPCFSYGDIRRVHRIYASN